MRETLPSWRARTEGPRSSLTDLATTAARPAPTPEEAPVLSIAEVAECGCPDWCHRDHQNE